MYIPAYNYICLILISSILFSCKSLKEVPTTDFDTSKIGAAPIFSDLKYWAAHPNKSDKSDDLPYNIKKIKNETPPDVDVFFIYPTMYLDGKNWNADVNDKKLNKSICNMAIYNQATVFAGISNVYSPFYRQMHFQVYKEEKEKFLPPFKLAYSDVEKAFLYYWKHWNKGKPFVIASHSQGTNHAEHLIKKLILNNDSMYKQLQLAYLIGMPIIPFSEKLPVCESADQTKCFLSWRTFADGVVPDFVTGDTIACVNPLTWKTDTASSKLEDHKGILFRSHRIKCKAKSKARISNGLLWVKFKKIPFMSVYKRENYHIADYNLFWQNIRNNFRSRIAHINQKGNPL